MGNGDNVPDGMIRADFSLDIPSKAKWLTLVSTTEAGSNLCDHAVWADSRLLCHCLDRSFRVMVVYHLDFSCGNAS